MTKAAELAKMGEVLTNSQIGGRRNIVINGAMQVDQRNSGSSVNLANAKVYAVDRFYWIESSSETPTGQRVTDAPNGFTHSVKITNTSTTTTPSYTQLVQSIEGNNVSQLYFGNSSAESVTLSFYVKSSLTGQFSASLRNGASNRSNVSTYTINSANTWERKTITFVGDTTGTWTTDTSVGLDLIFRLDDTGGTSSLNQWTATGDAFASGSVRFMGNASATWQITGVQMEIGEQATPFEHRSFGEELALCQRYFQKVGGQSGVGSAYAGLGLGHMFNNTTAFLRGNWNDMRSAPSMSLSGAFRVVNMVTDTNHTSSVALAQSEFGTNSGYYKLTFGSASATRGDGCRLDRNNDNTAALLLDSEL